MQTMGLWAKETPLKVSRERQQRWSCQARFSSALHEII